MSGNCAMGRPDIVTAPRITKMIESTIATIGLLTKNFAMCQFKGRRCLLEGCTLMVKRSYPALLSESLQLLHSLPGSVLR